MISLGAAAIGTTCLPTARQGLGKVPMLKPNIPNQTEPVVRPENERWRTLSKINSYDAVASGGKTYFQKSQNSPGRLYF